MNPTQTTQGDQKTATGDDAAAHNGPFEQIAELERREAVRVEKELLAMQKEKEEVAQSVAKKEEAAMEDLKVNAKKELKQFSEAEITQILKQAKEDAEKEAAKLEASYASKEDAAVKSVTDIALDPDSLFSIN